VDAKPGIRVKRLALLALGLWVGRWLLLELAVRLHRRRPLRSAKDSSRAPGWMPLRGE
jgi:hypothetical protein